MNFKRALIAAIILWIAIFFEVSIILWIAIFFEVSILMFGFKLQTGTFYYLIHYVLAGILIILVCFYYFKKEKAKTGEGLLLGIILVVASIILDAAITVPLFIKSYSFFSDVYLWLGYFETILISVIFAAMKK